MQTLGINVANEEKRKSPIKGLVAVLIEIGVIFILVTNSIFVLTYFKIINLNVIFSR